jgi:thiol-disulfide isomerase/thioredoxin
LPQQTIDGLAVDEVLLDATPQRIKIEGDQLKVAIPGEAPTKALTPTVVDRGRLSEGLVIESWATGRAPCVEALPALEKLYAEYGDRESEVFP